MDQSLYLDLLKRVLTRYGLDNGITPLHPARPAGRRVLGAARSVLRRWNVEFVRRRPVDLEARAIGRDWPLEAETMVGLRRLDNVEQCVRDVVERGVPGDLMETGAWRGGVT